MPIRRRFKTSHTKPTELLPVVKLWLLRILVPLGGHHEFVSQHGFNNDVLAEVLGLEKWSDSSDRDFDLRKVRAELCSLHRTAEQKLHDASLPAYLSDNVARFAELAGLSDVDCRILIFTVLLHNEGVLDDTADYLGRLSSVRLFKSLAVILDLTEPQVRESLSTTGILAKSGLLSVDRSDSSLLRNKLDLLSQTFADSIFSFNADPVSLLRDTVIPSSAPELSFTDYEHITPILNVLLPYLKQATSTQKNGVNIFLYGQPGTGKSQLARVLAQYLDYKLFEITSENEDGDPVSGERRLRALRAAQSFFSNRRAILLFDEVEDVFHDRDKPFGKSTAQSRKAWINRTLEDNSVPVLWLSNSIGDIDPAIIRRFDMIIELPVPPKKQRERILSDVCGDLLPATALAHIAESEDLAPAVVTRAASIISAVQDDLGKNNVAPALQLLIDNTLKAQGHKTLKNYHKSSLPETYDPLLINCDTDLVQLSAGLLEAKSGRICLYGPPGTGKTAYARWLAQQLGSTLIIKRVSDLISMYVGQNEKNIARAFEEAEQEEALLLIDEVDSFLQDRRTAGRSWEITLVNEMLTQMESFNGVFIASTNLMGGLDQAALRRFDLKLMFDFLKAEQSKILFERYCSILSLHPSPCLDLSKLGSLDNLTPGDFAAVARRHRIYPIASSSAFIDALSKECSIKEGPKRAIGFHH